MFTVKLDRKVICNNKRIIFMVTLTRVSLYLVVFITVFLGMPGLEAQVSVTVPNGSSSTSNGGVNASGSWVSSSGGFDLSWSVVKEGSVYDYVYSITNASGNSLSSGAAYLLLQVSPTITSSNLSTMITSASPGIIYGPDTFTSSETGTSGNLYGIVFGNSSGNSFSTLSFTSTLAPVWGSYYAINSNGSSSAYNTGYSTNPSTGTTNSSDWVATPGVAVPEPSTWLILGSFLAILYLWKAKRANSKNITKI